MPFSVNRLPDILVRNVRATRYPVLPQTTNETEEAEKNDQKTSHEFQQRCATDMPQIGENENRIAQACTENVPEGNGHKTKHRALLFLPVGYKKLPTRKLPVSRSQR
jgi:hypothetical protein